MNEFNNILLSEDNLYQQFDIQETQLPQSIICNGNVQSNFFSQSSIGNVFDEVQQPSTYPQNSSNSTNTIEFPFVRIHAFDSQPSSYQINNTPLVTNSTNNREIKPKIESIKSELNDSLNLTQQQNAKSLPDENKNLQSQSDDKNTSKELHIFKCNECMFLTICRDNLEKHKIVHKDLANRNIAKQTFKCPGCDNIFYSESSLCFHLTNDHFMVDVEVTKFLKYLKTVESGLKKNRIYLKNVECLREQPVQSQSQFYNSTENELLNVCNNFCDDEANDFDNDLTFIDLINEENNENLSYSEIEPINEKIQTIPNNLQQKITIKCVKKLCEPIYLQEPFNDNILNGSNFDQNCTTNVLNVENTKRFVEQETSAQETENPRRVPKIYIKNVDILKEPIYFPPTNVSNILNINENLNFNIFPTQQINLPLSQSHLSNITDIVQENFPKDQNYCETNQFSNNLNNKFNENNNINQLKDFQHNTKNKICVKNVEVLKQPQFQTNPVKKLTNFIHLRTVDELNLMNKNQLNLMNDLNQNDCQDNLNTITEINSKERQEECSSNNDVLQNITSNSELNKNSEYQKDSENIDSIQSNWTNYNYGFDNLENIIDSNSSSAVCDDQKNSQSLQNYVLNTPQRINTDETIALVENDEEMLLVCAEELISSHHENLQNGDKNYDEIQEYVENHLINAVEDDKIHQTTTVFQDKSNNFEIPHDINFQTILQCNSNTVQTNLTKEITAIPEKGRIYVSEHLMENKNENNKIIDNCLDKKLIKKSKGRPFGSKTNRNHTLNILNSDFKCDFMDCAYRFKMDTTLAYHKKCHISGSSYAMECPECHSKDFSGWNTLHTHLWRNHQIDMELYCCELCKFKTPILSRLLNTHNKIHSEERNFKCDQCEKAFKNSKQLKNHRRIHRTWKKPTALQKCEKCSSVFSNVKSKKDHLCQQMQNSTDELKCSICDKLFSSKSALKLHVFIHQQTYKFKCNHCDYGTSDHNAFRRHKSTHDKSRKYECFYCGYKCIQSILYKKHINLKHPEIADSIIHKCVLCSFSTINQTQFHVHIAKHDNDIVDVTKPLDSNNSENCLITVNCEILSNNNNNNTTEQRQLNKIKVKSDLVLTDPSKFLLQT